MPASHEEVRKKIDGNPRTDGDASPHHLRVSEGGPAKAREAAPVAPSEEVLGCLRSGGSRILSFRTWTPKQAIVAKLEALKLTYLASDFNHALATDERTSPRDLIEQVLLVAVDVIIDSIAYLGLEMIAGV